VNVPTSLLEKEEGTGRYELDIVGVGEDREG
jgi:hypothetical protein